MSGKDEEEMNQQDYTRDAENGKEKNMHEGDSDGKDENESLQSIEDLTEAKNVLGNKEYEKGVPFFSRSNLTPRSPVDTAETPAGVLDLSAVAKNETPKRTNLAKKRRLTCSPEWDNCMDEYRKTVEKICRKSDMLNRLTRENKNTKKEIKDVIKSLSDIVKDVRKIEQNWVQKYNEELFPSLDSSLEYMEEDETTEGNNEEDVVSTTKPVYCNKCNIMINKEKHDLDNIHTMIKQLGCQPAEEELYELLTIDWPDPAFCNTEKKEGKITKQPPEKTKVILVEKEEAIRLMNKEVNWIEELVEQKGILRTASERLNKPIFCEKKNSFKVLGENNNIESPHKKVFLMAIENKLDRKNLLDLYNAIKIIGENIAMENELNVTIAGVFDESVARKMLELVFITQKIKSTLIIPSVGKKHVDKNTEAIIIRTGENTYADMARKIKDGIKPETLGLNIKSFKETKDGDVLIVTKIGEAGTLRTEIEKKIEDAQIENKFGMEQVNILDLDPSCTKEEITDVISNTIEIPKEFINVKNLRSNRRGCSIATVALPAMDADKLAKVGMIKVGWIWCRIKTKVTITRCTNCLEVGHSTIYCKRPRDHNRKCFNCSQPGHMAIECTSEKYCTKCRISGHRNDTFSCPFYRELVHQ